MVELTITPDFQWDPKVHGRAEPFWVFVEARVAETPRGPILPSPEPRVFIATGRERRANPPPGDVRLARTWC